MPEVQIYGTPEDINQFEICREGEDDSSRWQKVIDYCEDWLKNNR